MKKNNLSFFIVLTMIFLTFVSLLTPQANADSLGVPENQQQLDNLIDKGFIQSNVQLQDLQRDYTDEEEIPKILPDDDLEQYGLTLNADGEIISIPDEAEQENHNFYAMSKSSTYYPGTKVRPRKGDIIVTTDTSSFGITGHVGIVTDPSIMHFKNMKAPGPRPTSYSSWFSTYKNGKVIRLANSQIVTNAANWAASKRNAQWSYSINGGISVLDPNYCSKFVYQAFNMGNKKTILAPWKGVIAPYDFLYSRLYPNTSEVVIAEWNFPKKGDF